jgi:hypothetical protein
MQFSYGLWRAKKCRVCGALRWWVTDGRGYVGADCEGCHRWESLVSHAPPPAILDDWAADEEAKQQHKEAIYRWEMRERRRLELGRS